MAGTRQVRDSGEVEDILSLQLKQPFRKEPAKVTHESELKKAYYPIWKDLLRFQFGGVGSWTSDLGCFSEPLLD